MTNSTFSCNICQVARRCYERKIKIDAWLSLVERCVRDAEVAGSNPVASTLGRGAGAFEEIQMFRFFLLKRKKLRSGRRGSTRSGGPWNWTDRSGSGDRRFKSCRIDSWQGRRDIWRNSDVPVFYCILKNEMLL